jgi:hypothetical protein
MDGSLFEKDGGEEQTRLCRDCYSRAKHMLQQIERQEKDAMADEDESDTEAQGGLENAPPLQLTTLVSSPHDSD